MGEQSLERQDAVSTAPLGPELAPPARRYLRYPAVPCGIALLRLSWAVSGLALLHVPQV